MSDRGVRASGYLERSTASLSLRCSPGTYVAERLDELAARGERAASHIDKRLKPLAGPGRRFERIILFLEAETPGQAATPGRAASPADRFLRAQHDPVQVLLRRDSSVQDLLEGLALAMVYDRLGGADVWRPASQADAAAIAHVLEFLAVGLARHLASQAERRGHGRLFADAADGTAPRQSADQVCRQVAADREGKVPLYESMMRGADLAGSPPEYAALAESFCGYLFEREGPKAYQRLVKGCRTHPNEAADVVYGKSLEQLQDEWLGAILRAYGRRPVTLKAFARQMIPYLRPYSWQVTLTLLLIFFTAAVAQVAPFAVRDVVDILGAAAGKGDPDIFADFYRVLVGGQLDFQSFSDKHAVGLEAMGRLFTKLGVLALANFVNLCGIVWLVYMVHVVAQNILRDLRVQLTNRLHHLSAGFYARQRMGDMITRFSSDIPRLAEPLSDAAAYSTYYVIFLIATVYSMLVMSRELSVLLFVIVPIYIYASRKLGPAIQTATRTRQERLAGLNANFEEMLFGHTLIKTYGLGGPLLGRFLPKIGEYRKVAIWADFLRSIYREALGVVDNVQTKLVLALGGVLVILGQITLGTVVSFMGLAGRFLIPLHGLSQRYVAVAVAAASLRRIEEVLREPMEMMDVPPGGSFAPEGVREGIAFEHVSFSYGGAKPTLVDINLQIPAGSKVAFVGPTGAGKSTLVSLLPRFYDVDEGTVKIDGRDLRSFSLAGLRQSISTVSQDTFVFNSTVMDNIRLARMDASDDEVIEAAKGARLHEFVMTLPAGYETLVGERGSRLSGGQKQRVAIARALLRQSPILILDEATTALDAETESEILAELDEVTRGKTVISITHRLGLAIKSEKIYVLQVGRIVQQGSHEELMREPGLYRKLFEDQNRELIERGAVDPVDATLNLVRYVPAFSMVLAPAADAADLPTAERYSPGEVFRRADDADGKLYLLRSGQVELTVHTQQDPEQRLRLEAPAAEDGAAKMALLLNIPVSVSARALTEAELQVIRREDLRLLVGAAPGAPASAASEGPSDGAAALSSAAVGQWLAQPVEAPPAKPPTS